MLRSDASVAAFAACVGFACYLNSVICGFVFDDRLAIIDNADVQHGAPLADVWVNDFWGKSLRKTDSHKSYRPLTVLSFRAHTWWRQGPPEPAPFHAVNAALHAVACAGVAVLGARAWRGTRRGGRRVALLASLLFAAHPVHVEAVTGTVGRAELLCAIACLGGAAGHAVAAGLGGGGGGDGALAALARLGGVSALCACFAAAVLSKELGVVLPPILAAQELLVVLPARGRRGAVGVTARLVLLAACAAAYIALRLVLMAPEGASHYSLKSASLAESQLIRRAENPLAFVRGRLEWALSVGWLQVYFAKLLFVPTTYCVEYSYDCVPMVEQLSDGRNALTLALLLALLRFAAHLLARAGRPDARATMALSAWLLLPWALVSHVPLRLGTLIAERTLYLPSAGALLLVAHILRPPPRASAVRRRWWGRRAAPLVGLAVGVLARRCLLRTLDWRTDETAFVAAVAVCPRSSKIQQQMCTLRTNQGQLAAARVHCAAAHAIDPEFCDVRFSMGSLAVASGDEGGAIAHYNASLPCPFTATKAYPMLLRVYDLVHRRSPKNGTLHEQIASTHSVVGNTAAAATLYREAAALHLAANRPRDALRAVAAAEAAHRQVGPLVEAQLPLGPQPGTAAADDDEHEGPTPPDCTLGYWRGMALVRLGKTKKARTAFARVTADACRSQPERRAIVAAAAKELRRLDDADGTSAAAATAAAAARGDNRRVLLLSFHGGVQAAVRRVAAALGWELDVPDVSEWLGGPCDLTLMAHDGAAGATVDGEVQVGAQYRMSDLRAGCLWRDGGLKARLAPYAMVVVADTAALARPMLQAGWPDAASGARLLLWVCNRFDYGVVGDAAYYQLWRQLPQLPRVTVVASTAAEISYAAEARGVDFPSAAVIKPLGLLADGGDAAAAAADWSDPIPPSVDRARTLFLLPKINEARLGLRAALEGAGIAVWTPGTWPHGMQRWGGPRAVASFRAALHVPYAPTTFALFEHAQAGLLTFVPSAALLLRWYKQGALFFQATPADFVATRRRTADLTAAALAATEWYDAENAPCFVYFDSLDDLKAKLPLADDEKRREALREWAARHTNSTIGRWRMIDRFLVRGEAA